MKVVPSRTEVEASLFRNGCWCRGRLLEAAFGLLLGATLTEASAHTRVAPATVAKVARVLTKETWLSLKKGNNGPGVPVKLSEEEKEFVHRAVSISGKKFGLWCRDALLAAASAESKAEPPEDHGETVDWDEAARLAGGSGVVAPVVKTARAPSPAPSNPATRQISVPRDPDVVTVSRGKPDRLELIRSRFRPRKE